MTTGNLAPSSSEAQDYFEEFGCGVLAGNGTAFYYVDWDEDAPRNNKPSWGLFDHNGTPRLNLDCSNYKPDTSVVGQAVYPKWLGGTA